MIMFYHKNFNFKTGLVYFEAQEPVCGMGFLVTGKIKEKDK